MPMPLEGTRVVDWTIWQQGPVCSLMLADIGAEVIKIEEPNRGDPGRSLTKMSGVDIPGLPNFYLEATNRNKKSVTLDLKTADGREIVYDLVAKSDVFVQNFRKGVAGRLGLDYATLRRHNPRLVYASGTGYGPRGPDSEEPSFDRLGLARSGIMFAVGEPDMPPQPIFDGVADQMAAACLAYGVLAALIVRDRFGIGQEIDASLLGSMMWLQNISVSARLLLGIAVPRMPRAYAANPLWNQYRCSDGRWIALGMMQADRYWPALCTTIGRPELATDERFANMRVRAGNAGECVRLLDEAFATRPCDVWIRDLRAQAISSAHPSTASTTFQRIRRCARTTTSWTWSTRASARSPASARRCTSGRPRTSAIHRSRAGGAHGRGSCRRPGILRGENPRPAAAEDRLSACP